MKYHQILAALTQEPLLITPSAQSALLKLFEQHASLSAEAFKAAREGTDPCGQAVDIEQAQVIDGIAHIPISGPIGYRLGSFEKGAGAVDVADVSDELDSAEGDNDVRGIILDIDSPGGMVNGTPELADRIAAVEKPIYAYSGGMIASAAYWLASAADSIFLTKSADAGSIGVYAPFVDYSQMAAQRGMKVQVFSSGKYKGMGVPGTSLTPDQEALMQERVLEIAEMFYEQVRRTRPDVADDTMQGQVFKGQAAVERGLADKIVRDKSEVVDLLS